MLCLRPPPTAKPNRGDWLLRSQTTRPAFSRCRPAATARGAACRCGCGPAHRLSGFEGRRPQARLGEGLHRTRHFHLAVLNRRSASLWPTTNRWFFGKASTRSSRLLHRTGHQLTMPSRGSATLPQKIIASLTPAQSGSKTKGKTMTLLSCTPRTQAPKG